MGTTKSYVAGFALSLFLTGAAYLAVVNKLLSGAILTSFVISLALTQLVVQLIFFLHLGQEENPRFKLVIFLSTFFIFLIVLLGSIWIMSHLNYNHMTPNEMNIYILHNEGINK